jgi:hypothetical protein
MLSVEKEIAGIAHTGHAFAVCGPEEL